MEDALTADDPFKIKSGGLVDMKSMKGLYLFVCMYAAFYICVKEAFLHLYVLQFITQRTLRISKITLK